MKKTKAWWIFIIERFEPISHLIMIFVFLMAHILVVNPVKNIYATALDDLILFIGVTIFYFKLRLYDEIKDYELDVVINPNRPLPRALLSHKDLYQGIGVCIFLEILCFSIQGLNSLYSIFLTILYSLLMYKEFFIPKIIRPHLTTYAIVHTVVTAFLSFSIFSFLTKENVFQIMSDKNLLSFAFTNWLLFNIFEFGRKTFATNEERVNVDTYSSLFGRTGSVLLVVSQAIAAHYFAFNLSGVNHSVLIWGFGSLISVLFILSIFYIIKDSTQSAKNYRMFSSIYIVAFYLILITSHIVP
jgi:4-hydroxybenzoate polyprenyltransferase